MSYILDALRKSHQERHPGTRTPRGAVHDLSASWSVGGVGLVLALIAILGLAAGIYYYKRGARSAVSEPTESTVTEAPTSKPIPVATAATAPKAVAPVAKEAAGASPSSVSSVVDLAEQAKVPEPVETPKPAPARATTPAAKQSGKEDARKPVVAAALPVADAPLLQQMPQAFQNALPPLAVTIHVYSTDETQRILFINNREYRVGGWIEGGIQVEAIVPDGAILSYRGERFKLSRPR